MLLKDLENLRFDQDRELLHAAIRGAGMSDLSNLRASQDQNILRIALGGEVEPRCNRHHAPRGSLFACAVAALTSLRGHIFNRA